MNKKIKKLEENEINVICKKFGELSCSDKCPLYRVEKNRMRLCMNIGNKNYKFNAKELNKLNEEIIINLINE